MKIQLLVLISILSASVSAFGESESIQYSKEQKKLADCLRTVIQNTINNGTEIQVNKSHQDFSELAEGIDNTFYATNPKGLKAKTAECTHFRKTKKIYRRDSGNTSWSLLNYVAANSKISLGLKNFINHAESYLQPHCSGATLSVKAAALLGVDAGVSGHLCMRPDGRRGLFLGTEIGIIGGAGVGVDVITDTESFSTPDELKRSHQFLFNSYNVYWRDVANGKFLKDGPAITLGTSKIVSEEDGEFGNEAYTAGRSFGLMVEFGRGDVGGSFKFIPLKTDWQWLLDDAFGKAIKGIKSDL